MKTRTKEAVRYLGYGRHAVDDDTLTLIESSFEELDQVKAPRIVYRIFNVQCSDEEQIEIEKTHIHSRSLVRNLKNCDEIFVLAATLGTEVDRMLRRYSLTDMARTVVLQACAAAELEEYLDQWQEHLQRDLEKEGKYLRPRFSPGYGDFSIEHQEEVLRMLEAGKKIGLTMTSGWMLTPTKSVTAIIGVSTKQEHCSLKGCEVCSKVDCIYRR